MKERVHKIGRAVAWTCGASGGRESRKYLDSSLAWIAAGRLREHIKAGGHTGAQTMRDIAELRPAKGWY